MIAEQFSKLTQNLPEQQMQLAESLITLVVNAKSVNFLDSLFCKIGVLKKVCFF